MRSQPRVTRAKIAQGPFGLAVCACHLPASFFRYYPPKEYRRWRLGLLSLTLIVTTLIPIATNIDGEADQVFKGHKVTITAYTNVPACTDSTPDETASLLRIRPKHYGKVIALSRDLAKSYRYGDKFELWIHGKLQIVEYQDLMARRHTKRVDLLLPSLKQCRTYGAKEAVLIPLKPLKKGSGGRG